MVVLVVQRKAAPSLSSALKRCNASAMGGCTSSDNDDEEKEEKEEEEEGKGSE